MSQDLLPKNWLIVDDHIQDAQLIASAIPEGSKVVDIAHDLRTAETQLKQKIYDVVILDYYFKGTKDTGVDLIPIIRDLFPGLPLIMISSSDEPHIVKAAIRAGADVFVKKYPNTKLLRSSLAVAAIQAQEFRAAQSDKGQYSQFFLTSEVRADLQATVRKRSEKVLITGSRGMGKTSLAHIFAASFVRTYYKNSPRSIIYVDCADSKMAEEILFSRNKEGELRLAAFDRALGGVLILDNLDALEEKAQERIKQILLSGSTATEDDDEVNIKKIKIISTANSSINSNSAALIAAATDLEVSLEPIGQLAPHADKILEKLANYKITFSLKAVEYLATAMKVLEWKMGYVSLSQFVNSAICHALENGKNKVYQADFPPLDSFEAGLRINHEKQVFFGKEGELLSYAVRSGRNYHAASKLLRKVMMNYASEIYEGNISAAAEALGVSRSSFSEL